MLAAERNVVKCFYADIRKKTSLSSVQKSSLPGSVSSRLRDVRGHTTFLFPVLLGGRYRAATHQSPRKDQKPTMAFSSFHRPLPNFVSKTENFIALIRNELNRIERSENNSEISKFASNLREKLHSWDGKKAFPALTTLRQAYDEQHVRGLEMQIKYLSYENLANRSFSKSDFADQRMIADLRYPAEWYPATRELQRIIHLHVGPTNSGKTYNALKRLEQAKHGIYAGPLRLLAHEVYTKLNAKGIPCHLITGDEKVLIEGEVARMISCTVEMVPINKDVDVAVIDEIQMIGDKSRGWAWTQAFLGVKARELHLCGEARTVPLIRELAMLTGEKLEIHHYERLSPLEMMSSSLKGKLKDIEKGDCIVVFSKTGIHQMKIAIEKQTRKRVAIIYGDLPPETRAQQARLFNDPDNDYDFLVATDAIGMGLNLSIRRIIFESTMKNNGGYLAKIEDHQIKQIAGRAGRYRAGAQIEDGKVSQDKRHDGASKNVGLVTTLESVDFASVTQGMENEPTPILTAGIFPTSEIVTRLAAYFPDDIPFSYILLRVNELALMHPRFHICELRDQAKIADIIEPVRNLTIRDRLIFTAAPVDRKAHETCKAFAQCVANNGGGGILEIKELNLEILDQKATKDPQYRIRLEALHKSLILYLWLGYRFEGVFHNRAMAWYVKGLVQKRIEKFLATVVAPRGSYSRKILHSRHQKAKIRELEVAHVGEIANGYPPIGDDGNLNIPKVRFGVESGGGRLGAGDDGATRSTQQPTNHLVDLIHRRNEVSESRLLEATT